MTPSLFLFLTFEFLGQFTFFVSKYRHSFYNAVLLYRSILSNAVFLNCFIDMNEESEGGDFLLLFR